MTETAGGLQFIREAVAARASRGSAQVIVARDCGVGIDWLDAFAKGKADIPDAEHLDLIVKWMWGDNIQYNSAADALEPVQKPEPRSIGIPPDFSFQVSINGKELSPFSFCPPPRGGPQPEEPAPKPKPRRGFG